MKAVRWKKKDGAFVFKAGDADTSFMYATNAQANMLVNDFAYFGLTATGGWDIKWVSTALNLAM